MCVDDVQPPQHVHVCIKTPMAHVQVVLVRYKMQDPPDKLFPCMPFSCLISEDSTVAIAIVIVIIIIISRQYYTHVPPISRATTLYTRHDIMIRYTMYDK